LNGVIHHQPPGFFWSFIDSILSDCILSITKASIAERKIREVPLELHGYFRSSASYRVRIALNLKGLTVEHLPHHLRKGEQRDSAYLALNPQGLVPTLLDDAGAILTQSLAIIEWLDENYPQPRLLPSGSLQRARVRAFSMAIACDIQPVQNLKVLARLRQLGLPEQQITAWAAWVNSEGLAACQALVAHEPGPFCFGDMPTLADLCLIPQLANARRFGVEVEQFPRLMRAEAAARSIKAFADAAPDRQPDAE
jgi:maleylpyruvate isomerase